MINKRRVYLLDPKKFSPETIAVTFAKTSRSPQTFDQIAEELSDEKSTKFHEKWVVGYGHASVAEHAVLHIALENVSRLAIECIESNRLASYTEKSSRYQIWEEDQFFIPPELNFQESLKKLYIQTCGDLFRSYKQSLPQLKKIIEEKLLLQKNADKGQLEREIHSQAADVCRYYLPAAAFANVGMTANARVIEHAICKMLSHPLQEVREIGEELKTTAQEKLPTLVKYANTNKYIAFSPRVARDFLLTINCEQADSSHDWCQLVSHEKNLEDKILAAYLFKHCSIPFHSLLSQMAALTPTQKTDLAKVLLDIPEKHDMPSRELEHSFFTFECEVDQGAYFEFKRHRMMTQSPQGLSVEHGYAVPKLITLSGLENSYNQLMKKTAQAYRELSQFNPEVAAYLVPNAFNRRFLVSLNLRAAIHLIKLRSAPNAHFAIRRLACRICDEIAKCSQLFSQHIFTSNNETWQSIEEENFSSVR